MGCILHTRTLGFDGFVENVEALLHPIEETIVVFEGNGVEVVELESSRAGEVSAEEDVLDDDGADFLV